MSCQPTVRLQKKQNSDQQLLLVFDIHAVPATVRRPNLQKNCVIYNACTICSNSLKSNFFTFQINSRFFVVGSAHICLSFRLTDTALFITINPSCLLATDPHSLISPMIEIRITDLEPGISSRRRATNHRGKEPGFGNFTMTGTV